MTDIRRDLILLADSDETTIRSIREPFFDLNMDIEAVGSGAVGISVALSLLPEAAVLEVDLPDISGFEVCRKLAGFSKTARIPIVFYTTRDQEVDVVVGFELGAADYVSKTVKGRELALRVRAILKRFEKAAREEILRIGKIVLDLNQTIAMKNGARIGLSPMEFQILTTLARAEGRVLKRSEIIASVWRSDSEVMNRTVDAHIKSIRAKIGDAGFSISTVRSIGYCLRSNITEISCNNNNNHFSFHHSENSFQSMIQRNNEDRK